MSILPFLGLLLYTQNLFEASDNSSTLVWVLRTMRFVRLIKVLSSAFSPTRPAQALNRHKRRQERQSENNLLTPKGHQQNSQTLFHPTQIIIDSIEVYNIPFLPQPAKLYTLELSLEGASKRYLFCDANVWDPQSLVIDQGFALPLQQHEIPNLWITLVGSRDDTEVVHSGTEIVDLNNVVVSGNNDIHEHEITCRMLRPGQHGVDEPLDGQAVIVLFLKISTDPVKQ
eukprot:c12358_g1_i1.p1 GENE.c12358_g1_i1~~c12358_g1_i1.p1  ORF type:complete len:228 (-),score=52.93 c12358_g1_i1:18-701(-)